MAFYLNSFFSPVLARIQNPVLPEIIGDTEAGATGLSSILSVVVTFLLIVGVLISFFWFFSGALHWISAGEDKNALGAARQKVQQALIGLVVLFCLFAIMKIVSALFGIDLVNLKVPSLDAINSQQQYQNWWQLQFQNATNNQ